jgi:phage terminase Nu1 subunit (DNA packaging protein)
MDHVTNIELAAWFGISRQAVAMLLARGVVKRCDDGLFDVRACTQSYTSHLREVAAGRSTEISEAKTQSLKAGVVLRGVQTKLAETRLARETKETVNKAEIIEALERLTLNTRNNILALPLKIRATLGLSIDAQESITVLVHDVLTQLSNGVFTIHEAVAYREKSFSELTSDEILAMSYAMMSNRTFLSDEDKQRMIDEIIREAEHDACAATPLRPVAERPQ